MTNLTKFPYVQYSGMDYDNIITDIQNIIKENPKWAESWSHYYESDAGTLLTEIMAYIGENISTRLDYSVNENYISTASQDKNKFKLLKLIGYNPSLATSAIVKAKVELQKTYNDRIVFTPSITANDDITLRSSKIYKINAKNSNGDSITFEALAYDKKTGKWDYLSEYGLSTNIGSSLYENDDEGNPILFHEGITKQQEFTSLDTSGVTFVIADTNVIEGSIRIFDRETRKEHLLVSNFIQKEALDENYAIPFITRRNIDGSVSVIYANDKILTSEKRRFTSGATIDVFYRVGGGVVGNIPSYFLNNIITVPLYINGFVKGTVYNELPGSGGSEAETADEAIINGPLATRTSEKAVTPEDYDIILNKYGNILKSKTYSSVNVPSTFKTKYGRYLNPQEALTLIMFNKDHTNVPQSKYNYYPWFELTKENRLNEKYKFATSNFNEELYTPDIGNKLTLLGYGTDPKLFTNFLVYKTSPIISQNVVLINETGTVYNENLAIKVTLDKTEETSFNNITNTIVYDIGENQQALTVNNPVVEKNVNAKYLSNKWVEQGKAFDVKEYGSIGLVLDDKGLITIDLLANLSTAEKATSKVYRLMTNTPIAVPSGYVWKGIESEAIYRYGLVELINSQIQEITVGNIYDEHRSIQYLGVGKNSATSIIESFDGIYSGISPEIVLDAGTRLITSGTFSFDRAININGTYYNFNFSDTIYNLSITGGYLLPEEAALAAHNNMLGITAMVRYNLTNGVNQWVNDAWDEVTPVILENDIYFDYELVKRFSVDNNNEYNYTSTYDFFFYSKTSNGLYTSSNYILIDYDYPVGNEPLINLLSNVSDIETDFLPKVIEAANYENVCSVINKGIINSLGLPVVAQYLQIRSPLVGASSTLYFINISGVNEKDFMRDFWDVKYYLSTGGDSEYAYMSNKATGVKRLTLLIDNQLVGYYNGTAIEPYSIGTIIYEHNNINLSYEISSTIYHTYKIDDNNNIKLGSVYDNFYLTGDTAIDDTYKSKIYSLLGTVYDETTDGNGDIKYTINKDRSNFLIKFTEDKKDTSSIYSIETDLDVIPVSNITLKTDEIGNLSSITGLAKNLLFYVDDMTLPLIIEDIDTFTSSRYLYEIIKNTINNRTINEGEARNYSNFSDDIIRYDYETKRVLVFGNVDKTDSGAIRFVSDPSSTDDENRLLFRTLFGTNLTNPDFYDLYSSDIIGENRVVVSSNEFYFYPGVDGIEFKYKAMVNNVARPGDYYINVETEYGINQNQINNFYLIKTANSNFQDKEFYIHFINDRTHQLNNDGTKYISEEETLSNYLENYIISGVENTFALPYIKTFDIKAEITYNASYVKAEIEQALENKIKSLYTIENASIGKSLSKSSLYKDIMTVTGVMGIRILYFGEDATNAATNVADEIEVDFDELLVLREDEYTAAGTKIRGVVFSYKKEGA